MSSPSLFSLFYFEVISNSQEIYKCNTKKLFSPESTHLKLSCSTVPTNKDIFLHNHDTITQAERLTLKHYYVKYTVSVQISPIILIQYYFLCANKNQLRITCCICLCLVSFHLKQFFTIDFHDLALTKAISRVFSSNLHSSVFPHFLLMNPVRWYIILICPITGDLTVDHRLNGVC